jgi:hypothetical protein
MNAEWNAVLEQAGAVRAADGVSHFGHPHAEARAALAGDVRCDLSHQGLIAVRGPETEAFLQGQLTCDVRQATPDHSLLGAFCSPKGRVLASFRLFRHEDAYLLELPGAMVAPTLSRLRKYVLRAKTTLEDASVSLARMGVAGPNAPAALERVLGAAPERANDVFSRNITVIRLPGPTPRFEVHGATPEVRRLWEALGSGFTPVGAEPWRLLEILAGTPTVYPETGDAFVPQMLNLQLLGAIGLQKGCYAGQEVVARTHYLGKLKRRMYLARVDSPLLPHPGDPLFSPQADASQSAGRLVDACPHPDGGSAVLAVALIDCAEQGTLRLGDASGPALRLESLPYGFEAAG